MEGIPLEVTCGGGRLSELDFLVILPLVMEHESPNNTVNHRL